MSSKDLKKGRLSAQDFELFKDNIHLSDEELAIKLNRPSSFIEKTRKRVYPNQKTGKWTKEDLDQLKTNLNKMSIDQLSRLLNRTEKNIISKIESLPQQKSNEINEIKNVKKTKVQNTKNVHDKVSDNSESYIGEVTIDSPELIKETKELDEKSSISFEKEVAFTGASSDKAPIIEAINNDDPEGVTSLEKDIIDMKIEKDSIFTRVLNFLKFW